LSPLEKGQYCVELISIPAQLFCEPIPVVCSLGHALISPLGQWIIGLNLSQFMGRCLHFFSVFIFLVRQSHYNSLSFILGVLSNVYKKAAKMLLLIIAPPCFSLSS
jgi:hypothetical protein